MILPIVGEFTIGFLTTSTAIIANSILAFFIYKNNSKSATNIIFVFLSFVTSVWLFAMHAAIHPAFYTYALSITRFTVFLAVPQSVSFFLLSHTLPSSSLLLTRRFLWTIIAASVVVMATTLSPYVFTGVERVNGGLVQTPGPAMPIFALFASSFSIAAIYVLVKKINKSTGYIRQQLQVVLMGIALMLGLIITTILLPVMFLQSDVFVPLSPLYAFFFLGATAYAIVKHRLFDIRFFLARALSYTLLVLLVTGVYTILLFGVATILFNIPLEEVDMPFFISGMGIAALLALTFQSVQRFIAELTNKVFYQGRYISDELLSLLTHLMTRTIDIERMTQDILGALTREMRVTKAAFLLLENHKASAMYGTGYRDHELLSPRIDNVVHELRTSRQHIVFEELEEGELKSFCRECDIAVVLPLVVENEEVGVLILGPKLSGELYNAQDIQVLDIFSHEAGIAIQNAKAYAEIKKFSAELEQKVQERTRELKAAQESELAKAREVARLKDEFVFIAAHELRAPVTAIRGFTELISDSREHMPESIKGYLHSMSAASGQLNQLVNDLLEIARSESGTMKIAVEPSYIVPIIQEAIDELAPVAEKKHVAVALAVRGEVPKVLADMQKLKEVVMNLLDNAIKYNREGGRVDITVFEQSDVLITEVRDTGYGIPAEDQQKIFQKFFRAPTKETQEVLGTGLGLFVIRMLIEKMGGKVMFSSREGEGSTFSFWLPIAKP